MNNNVLKLFSNYVNRFFSIISVFIFVPFYIKILGIESYAIIGFYSLLLGIIGFADMGMSSAVIKEFSLEKDDSYKFSVFRNIENLYLLICSIILIIIIFNTSFIAKHWLNSDLFSKSELSYFVLLIGVGTVIQLLTSLYFGAYFGLGEQVKANLFSLIWGISRMGLIIFILKYLKPSLEVYFIWQILCNLIYVLLLRYNIISKIKKDKNVINYMKKIPQHIIKYIGGMTFIAIISAVNTQADKIITSSFFSLKMFGYYNLVSILSQAPVMLGTPLVVFVFPIFSKYAHNGSEKLIEAFTKITFLQSIIIFPVVCTLFIFPEEVLKIWTRKNIENNMFGLLSVITRLLLIGSLFLSLQLPLFYFLLSKGKTKYTIYQGIVQVLIGVPILYFCAKFYGIKAVPIPWIIINIGSFIYLFYIVFVKFSSIQIKDYLINILFIPIIITISISIFLYTLYIRIGGQEIIYMFLIIILSLVFNIITNNIIQKRKLGEFNYLYNFPK